MKLIIGRANLYIRFMCQYDRKEGADTVWSVICELKNRKIYRVKGNSGRKRFCEDSRMKFNN